MNEKPLKNLVILTLILAGLLFFNSAVLANELDQKLTYNFLWWEWGENDTASRTTNNEVKTLDSAAANDLKAQDEAFIGASGLGTARPAVIISFFIKLVLSFLGVVFILLIIYAGFTWMTSAGNEEKITKAKKTMGAAVIGLAIVLSAYLITYFVVDKILEASGTATKGLD